MDMIVAFENLEKRVIIKPFIFLFAILLYGCNKPSETLPADLGFEFFPVQTIAKQTFKVDSIFFNDFTRSSDTTTFEEQWLWQFSHIENGDTIFEVAQYRSTDNGATQQFVKRFRAYRTNERAVVYNGNNPIVELIFPPKPSLSWNANQLNGFPLLEYSYDTDPFDTIMNGIAYQALKVTRWNDVEMWEPLDTFLYRDINLAIYAKEKGMVYEYIAEVKAKGITGEPTDEPVDSGVVIIRHQISSQ